MEAPGAVPLAPTQVFARLRLVNFRSYSDAAIAVDPGPVVLAGANGSGKTNCLEAISFLSPGRGLRGARLDDVQRKAPLNIGTSRAEGFDPLAAGSWVVAATLVRADGCWDLGTGFSPAAPANARRVTHLNGAPAQSADLAELAPMLWLTPAQDRLFVGGSSDRRRFLDRLVFGLDPAHARRATRYERAMRERLRLLRDGRNDPSWLTGLEDIMAEEALRITQARLDMIERLNLELTARRRESAFPCAHVTLEDASADATSAEKLRGRFACARSRDAESGRTSVGPHLADLVVRHTRKRADARDCSTGEQKALLISLVLANAWLQRRSRGGSPFLLLDEIAAHLDAQRRAALFEEISGLSAQAWMTGTDRNLFGPLKGRASVFAVEAGQFVRQE